VTKLYRLGQPSLREALTDYSEAIALLLASCDISQRKRRKVDVSSLRYRNVSEWATVVSFDTL
jgi:hypothetical protein